MKKQAAKTARIYYGTGKVPLYWTVTISDAKENVVLNGTIMDAILGTPGQTIGCHLSNCAKNNAEAFPHPMFLAAFTRRTAFVVNKVARGRPVHAIRYQHHYANLVDLNDIDHGKTIIKQYPELADRSFTLLKPFRRHSGPRGSDGTPSGVNRPKISKGALARARAAGLISADLANAVNEKATNNTKKKVGG